MTEPEFEVRMRLKCTRDYVDEIAANLGLTADEAIRQLDIEVVPGTMRDYDLMGNRTN